MNKLQRSKPTSVGNKRYWCRTGNHGSHKNELVIQFGDSPYGICNSCFQKQTQLKGTKHYWIDN